MLVHVSSAQGLQDHTSTDLHRHVCQTNAHTDWHRMVPSLQTLGLLTHSLQSLHGEKWNHITQGGRPPGSLGKMHPIHSVSFPSDLQRPGVAGQDLF